MMRLVCPNCEAKYEVPDDAIPDTGRDVQCANCGHAWYQMRSPTGAPGFAPAAEAAVEAKVETPASEPLAAEAVAPAMEPEASAPFATELEASAPAEDPVASPEDVLRPALDNNLQPAADDGLTVAFEDGPSAETDDGLAAAVSDGEAPLHAEAAAGSPIADVGAMETLVVSAPDTSDHEQEASPAFEPEAGSDEEASAPEPEAAMQGASAYAVDESVLAILREEAEREAQARRADGRTIETQTELGVDAARGSAKKRGKAVVVEEPKASARRDLLPDVEEINSTLRPSEQPDDEDFDGSDAQRGEVRSSFRSGFLLVMTITMLGSALYLTAPMIAEMVPALAGPLETFTNLVNGLRLQLDGLMRVATAAMNGDGG